MSSSGKIAVYPGSFDPITLGHVDIIKRAAELFEKVIVLIAVSPDKAGLFDVNERIRLVKKSLGNLKNVEVDVHEGLTIDYLKKRKSGVLVRGLRAISDFEYEVSMANINRTMAPEIETILILASPEYYFVSSRAVKEVALHGGSLAGLVNSEVASALKKIFSRKKGKK